eukprot:CAMPEP_0174746320 /NCGR_PEP_ID=MMETSP1094-20130205/88798_1 /TAXON_ID=156173 /ORGANISM="Chrysochromulina brevifilum, Strain UTEX LB 985" /LENGTH=56 /DNA_ID=CAMNT_0015951005 /DNA_START=24 /DNA_END=191 /DNA_ORIENTATION=-
MGKGKVAELCCDAAMQCFQTAQQIAPSLIRQWEETNRNAKVAVQCEGERQLSAIAK